MKGKLKYIIGGFVALILIAGVVGSGGDTDISTSSPASNQSNESSKPSARFTDRADIQPEDLEVIVGEPASIDGIKLVVSSVEYKSSISDFEQANSGKVYMLVNLTLTNESSDTKPYNQFNYRVQTASGQVLDSTFVTLDDQLNSGDLVAGGTISAIVPFEVPEETGNQYVIWKPNAFDAKRAIIRSSQE